MADCIIKINQDKIKLDAGEKSSFTQEDFDTWLREKLNDNSFRKQIQDFKESGFNPTFAIDLTEVTRRVQNFEAFESDVTKQLTKSKNQRSNSVLSGSGSVETLISFGVTSTFGLVGKSEKEIDEPVSKWEHNQKIADIRKNGIEKHLPQSVIDQQIADYERLSEFRKLDGQIFGALIQDTLTNSSKDLTALSTRKDVKSSLNKLGITWDQAVQRVKSAGQETIDKIVGRINYLFPNRKGVRTEFGVISKNVSKSLLNALNTALRNPNSDIDDYSRSLAGTINSLKGFIDIVIIDSVGHSHSFDIKLSSIDVNDYWPLSGTIENRKYNEIAAQQMAYYSMARQWGHRFASVNILPALITYDSKGNIINKIQYRQERKFDQSTPYRTICKNYFWYDEESSMEVVKESKQDIDKLFPGLRLSEKLSTKQFTISWFRNHYNNKVNDKYRIPIDARFPIEDYGLTTKNQYVYFNTWEEAEKFLNDIYIPRMNEIFSQSNIQLVEDLNAITKSNASIDTKVSKLEALATNISKDMKTQKFIVNIFKKYVCDGWQIVKDSSNDFANHGIFIFMKGDTAEIVMLDDGDLFAEYKLGKAGNSNILGNYVNDLASGTDDITTLPAYRGNLLAMQAMSIIAKNSNDIFTNRSVQAIRTVNLNFRQELTQFNDKLRNNWNDLVFYYNQENPDKPKFKTVGPDQLRSGIFALVNRANDISRLFLSEQVNFKSHANHISKLTDDSVEEILTFIRNLMAQYQINSSEDWAKHSDAFEAFTMLSQALLAARGYIVTMENDCGPYFEGIFLNGTKTMSAAESPSANVRLLSRIETVYERKIRDEYKKIIFPWQIAFTEAIKESGYDTFFANERDLFKLCFERDENGNITEDFVLLPPDKNKDLIGKEKLKKLVTMFLETINEYRIPDENERERLKGIPGSLYYQVPLTETTKWQEAKNSSWKETIQRRLTNIFDSTKDALFGDTMTNWELKQYDDISKERIYNSYLDTSDQAQELRMQKLAKEAIEFGDNGKHKKRFGVAAFETSLDVIFLRTMLATIRSQISTEFMPLFVGLRAFIAFNGNVSGANMDGIAKSVEEFIKSNIFHKRIIDPSETTIFNILSEFRNTTSIIQLTGNTVSFNREMITSWIRVAVNKTNDPLMKGAFDLEDYSSFMVQIAKEMPKNVDLHTKYMQINYRYGLANMTESELPGKMKNNRFNINNWAEDVLFLNTTTPDFVHRNSILCAVLKKRGSYDALYLDENKELQYDPKKDKQYELFFKYKDKESEIPSDLVDQYIVQRDLYNKARLDWNQTYGMNINYGEYLPDALSPTEAESVRTYADHVFGNFDSDKKATIQKTLLGSFVLQFRTFTLQQFMQNVRAKGYTNIVRSWHRTTKDGKKVYFVKSFTGEDVIEHPYGYFITEDEIENVLAKGTPLKNIEAVIDTAGGAVNGRFPSIIESAIDVFNPEVFKEKWSSSDVYKANLHMALIDNLGMLIIAALLRLLYGEETVKNIRNEDWWTRWSYTVLMGVAQDGPINQVVGSLIGNGLPPSVATLQTFFNNSYEIITGEKPVLYGLLNTFGATRQFTGMVLGQD